MKTWLIRGAVVLGLLVFGWVLRVLLEPLGYGWVVWVLAGLVGAFFATEMILRTRKRSGERADWARWKAALLDPPARRKAIAELRRESDRARRLGPRLAVRQTRLAVALAELWLADGKSDEATRTLARADASRLEPLQAAILRIARVQAYLHGGDVDGAAATLAPLEGDTLGDAVVDATLTLARGAVALEEGRLDEARAAAEAIVEAAEPHDELWDEAKALEAACRDAEGGDPNDALEAIRPPGRRRLAALGSARVRRLLEALDAA
ncbi:MAG: hypothetical protein R3B82_24345 [Sandaracinaceae bacterium]